MSRDAHMLIEAILIILMIIAFFFSLAPDRLHFVAARDRQSIQRDYVNLPGLQISQADLTNYPAVVVSVSAHLVGLVALMLLLPLFAWNERRIKKVGQPKIGFCSRCGYDLRASPDRCPECGLERDAYNHGR